MERRQRQRVENIVVGKIEHDIPLPPIGGSVGMESKYPFLRMKIGDSVVVSGLGKHSYNSIYEAAGRMKVKVAIRSVDGGFRVWRVKEKKS